MKALPLVLLLGCLLATSQAEALTFSRHPTLQETLESAAFVGEVEVVRSGVGLFRGKVIRSLKGPEAGAEVNIFIERHPYYVATALVLAGERFFVAARAASSPRAPLVPDDIPLDDRIRAADFTGPWNVIPVPRIIRISHPPSEEHERRWERARRYLTLPDDERLGRLFGIIAWEMLTGSRSEPAAPFVPSAENLSALALSTQATRDVLLGMTTLRSADHSPPVALCAPAPDLGTDEKLGDCEWLSEVTSEALQKAVDALGVAYTVRALTELVARAAAGQPVALVLEALETITMTVGFDPFDVDELPQWVEDAFDSTSTLSTSTLEQLRSLLATTLRNRELHSLYHELASSRSVDESLSYISNAIQNLANVGVATHPCLYEKGSLRLLRRLPQFDDSDDAREELEVLFECFFDEDFDSGGNFFTTFERNALSELLPSLTNQLLGRVGNRAVDLIMRDTGARRAESIALYMSIRADTGPAPAFSDEELQRWRTCLESSGRGETPGCDTSSLQSNAARVAAHAPATLVRALQTWQPPDDDPRHYEIELGLKVAFQLVRSCDASCRPWLLELLEAKDDGVKAVGGVWLAILDNDHTGLSTLMNGSGVPAAWAALSLARRGEVQAMDRLVELLSTFPPESSSPNIIVRTVALLSNTAARSGAPQPELGSSWRLADAVSAIREWWSRHRDSVELRDPWLEELSALGVD